VISEHQFAAHFSSVWHSIAPLSDGFWAFENKQVDRIQVPLRPIAPKGMRAVINEAAFRAFCEIQPSPQPPSKGHLREVIHRNFQHALDYIARFSNAAAIQLSDVDSTCHDEALALVGRLALYFPAHQATILKPSFAGCGLLSACEGDLIANNCLYEIKAGDRAFRVLDLRQLLTYAALAYASRSLTFSHVGLFNPRTGVAWRRSLDEVCESVSGLRPTDTLSALIEQFSVASASR
jgi:hypothetical protein